MDTLFPSRLNNFGMDIFWNYTFLTRGCVDFCSLARSTNRPWSRILKDYSTRSRTNPLCYDFFRVIICYDWIVAWFFFQGARGPSGLPGRQGAPGRVVRTIKKNQAWYHAPSECRKSHFRGPHYPSRKSCIRPSYHMFRIIFADLLTARTFIHRFQVYSDFQLSAEKWLVFSYYATANQK